MRLEEREKRVCSKKCKEAQPKCLDNVFRNNGRALELLRNKKSLKIEIEGNQKYRN